MAARGHDLPIDGSDGRSALPSRTAVGRLGPRHECSARNSNRHRDMELSVVVAPRDELYLQQQILIYPAPRPCACALAQGRVAARSPHLDPQHSVLRHQYNRLDQRPARSPPDPSTAAGRSPSRALQW